VVANGRKAEREPGSASAFVATIDRNYPHKDALTCNPRKHKIFEFGTNASQQRYIARIGTAAIHFILFGEVTRPMW
jgi:hypothetical protein